MSLFLDRILYCVDQKGSQNFNRKQPCWLQCACKRRLVHGGLSRGESLTLCGLFYYHHCTSFPFATVPLRRIYALGSRRKNVVPLCVPRGHRHDIRLTRHATELPSASFIEIMLLMM